MKAQSEIIENLSHQVSSAVKGTGNEKKFKQMFDMIANHSSVIHNVTKRLNKTILHVDELAGAWSESTVRIGKELKSLEKETEENKEDIEDMEKRVMVKIEKLQEEVKTLRVSLNYAQAESAAIKEGKLTLYSNKSSFLSFEMSFWNLRYGKDRERNAKCLASYIGSKD